MIKLIFISIITFFNILPFNNITNTSGQMFRNKIDYKSLNAKEKENYNYHKVASVLADYGYDSMRLNNDWQGADFIAVKGDDMLKIQLKGRFTLDKKYIGKDIFIAFIENDTIKLYEHDKAVELFPESSKNTVSWKEKGQYSWLKTPARYNTVITVLK